MNNIVFVDNDRLYFEAVRDLIETRLPDDYKVDKYIRHPAPKGNFSDGPLIEYLSAGIEASSDTFIVMLDIHFGNREEDHKLGINVAEQLIETFGLDGRVKLLCMTNYSNRLYYDELYKLGVKVFIFKPNLEHTVMAALDAALNEEVFTPGYVPDVDGAESEGDLIRDEVSKMIAKGFKNKTLREGGYPSVDTQKLTFKRTYSLPPLNNLSGHRMPNDNEWNDIFFLLYYLSEKDKEIIDYVEQVCNIRITIPN